MPKNQETTTKFKVDISELKRQFSDAQRQIRLANSEFKAATAGMDNWGKSADGLSAKIKQLSSVLDAEKSKLTSLEQQYAQVVDEQGDTSKGAQELAIKINNQKAAIANVERQLRSYEGELEEVSSESDGVAKDSDKAEKGIDDVGDAAKDSDGKVGNFAKGLANLAKTGLAAVATAAAGVVTAFLGSAEATREYREDMNKLKTAYETAGLSAKTAQSMYEGFFSVLGEEDRSVEAVNHLAKLTKNQDELSKWTDICAGVWGTFGDSLPIEGLTEAANETAKVGKVVGPLADALNWAGISEDDFNKKLEACNGEQERATLITNTLNSTYKDAAENYKELNGDIMDAQLAQSKLNDAMASVGKAAEPIMTTLKLFGVEILTSMLPSIEGLANGFTDLTNGVEGADKKIGDAISNILTTLVGKITEMLPTIATVGVNLIISLINGIVASLPEIAASASEILSTLINGLVTAAPQLISTAGTLLTTIYEGIMKGIPLLIKLGAEMLTKLGKGISDNLPKLTSKALDALDGFVNMLTDNLPKLLDAGISFITNMVKGIMDSLPTFIEKAPEIITKFANLINDNMPKILKAAVNIILTIVKGIIKAIPTLVKNIPKIFTAFVSVWEAFNWVSLGKKAITFLKDGILKMVSSVKSAGTSILNSITDALKSLPEKLFNFGKNAIKNIGTAIQNGISTVKAKASNVLTGIVNAFKPDSLFSVGKDLIKGLWNGISDMSGWIADKINGFSKGVLKGIKKFFGIHSPSKVMRDQVGKFLPLGLAEGITRNVKPAVQAMSTMASAIMVPAKSVLSDLNTSSIAASTRTSAYQAPVNNVYNFNQTNNSPKPLSRLEIYRQTRNQLALLKGV